MPATRLSAFSKLSHGPLNATHFLTDHTMLKCPFALPNLPVGIGDDKQTCAARSLASHERSLHYLAISSDVNVKTPGLSSCGTEASFHQCPGQKYKSTLPGQTTPKLVSRYISHMPHMRSRPCFGAFGPFPRADSYWSITRLCHRLSDNI